MWKSISIISKVPIGWECCNFFYMYVLDNKQIHTCDIGTNVDIMVSSKKKKSIFLK